MVGGGWGWWEWEGMGGYGSIGLMGVIGFVVGCWLSLGWVKVSRVMYVRSTADTVQCWYDEQLVVGVS